MRYLLIEGKISCTLVHLDGISRRETKDTVFRDGIRIPDIKFSRGETFKFSLTAKEEEERNPLTQITERSRQGEMGFFVFLPGVQRAAYSGGRTFSLHLIKTEQRFNWEDIAVNQYPKGRMGTISVELSLKIVA